MSKGRRVEFVDTVARFCQAYAGFSPSIEVADLAWDVHTAAWQREQAKQEKQFRDERKNS